MTNYEKLAKTNLYDWLCDLNRNLTDLYCYCIMEAITEGVKDSSECDMNCSQCISDWLREESET